MCRNHSHMALQTLVVLVGDDGSHVSMGTCPQPITAECPSFGGKFTAPANSIVLIVSPAEGAESYLPEAVMEALSVLLSMGWRRDALLAGATTQTK